MVKEALLKTVKHSIVFGIGKLTNSIIGFVLIPVYTRFVIPSDYGIFAMINVVGSIASICLDMGLKTAIFRFYFLFKEKEKRKEVISTVFFWNLVAGMIGTVILIISSGSISSVFLKTQSYSPYLILIFLTVYFRLLKSIPLAILRAKEKSSLYSILSIIDFISGMAFNIYFVVFLKRGVIGILEAGLIKGIITTPLFYAFIRNEIRLHISFKLSKRLLRFGLPLVPANLASLILILSDRYFLTTYSSLKEVGLYSLGYKFGVMINILFVQPFQLIWPTMLFSMSDSKKASEYYSRILTYFLMVVGGIALVFSTFAKEIISLVAEKSYVEAYRIIPMIAFSYVAYGVYFIVAVGVNLKEKTYYLPWVVGSAAGLNLVLNYLFIPRYGMMGAAVATSISYVFLASINYFVNQRCYRVNYDWKRITALVLFFILTVVIFSNLTIRSQIIKLFYCFGYFLFVWIVILEKKSKKGFYGIMRPFRRR